MVNKEIFTSIIDVYGRDVFTFGELYDILRNSGFSFAEASLIVRDAIDNGQIGRVSFRKLKRNLPRKNSFVVLSVNNRKNSDIYGKI